MPSSADVAIVGAGITGLCAARELAGAGRSVVVLDARGIGGGASSINGGMVNIGLKAPVGRMFRRYGPEAGRIFWDASLAAIDRVEEVVRDEAIDCYFVRNGAAKLGEKERDLGRFEASSEWLRSTVEFETTVVHGDALRGVVGSGGFRAALVDSAGAGLHPAAYVDGLARAAAGRGAQIVAPCRVGTIERSGGGYDLGTEQGRLRAGRVLMATNGYTERGPLPALRRRVVPVGSYIIVTEPLRPDVAERLIPGGRMLWTARRLLNYFRRTHDDRLLFGGRNDLTVDLDWRRSAGILHRTACGIFPELEGVRVAYAWGGRLGVTFDLMPHIGKIDGIWYALGYGGHGVGVATYLGSEVGRLMAGSLDRSPFAELAHPTRPYYRNRAWFLPAAARWYRLLDRLGA